MEWKKISLTAIFSSPSSGRNTVRWLGTPNRPTCELVDAQNICSDFSQLCFITIPTLKVHCSKIHESRQNISNFCDATHTFSSSEKLQPQCFNCTDNAKIRSSAKIRMLTLQRQRHHPGRQIVRCALQTCSDTQKVHCRSMF